MTKVSEMIDVERQGDTLVLTPQRDMSEMDFQEIEEERNRVLHLLANERTLRNMVLDFSKTDYFGSTALALFVRLGQKMQDRHGCMVFCNLSPEEVDILMVTGLGKVWSIYLSREEALAAVNS